MDDALVDSPLTLHITLQVGVKFCAGLRPTSQEAFLSWWAVGIAYQDPKLPTDCILYLFSARQFHRLLLEINWTWSVSKADIQETPN